MSKKPTKKAGPKPTSDNAATISTPVTTKDDSNFNLEPFLVDSLSAANSVITKVIDKIFEQQAKKDELKRTKPYGINFSIGYSNHIVRILKSTADGDVDDEFIGTSVDPCYPEPEPCARDGLCPDNRACKPWKQSAFNTVKSPKKTPLFGAEKAKNLDLKPVVLVDRNIKS